MSYRSAERERIAADKASVSAVADKLQATVDHLEPFRLFKLAERKIDNSTDEESDEEAVLSDGTCLLRTGCTDEDVRALLLRYARLSLGKDDGASAGDCDPAMDHGSDGSDDPDPPHCAAAQVDAAARLAADLAAAKAALMAETRRAHEAVAAIRAAALLPAGAEAAGAERAAGLAALQEELTRRRY